jgi:hypothetical protein
MQCAGGQHHDLSSSPYRKALRLHSETDGEVKEKIHKLLIQAIQRLYLCT